MEEDDEQQGRDSGCNTAACYAKKIQTFNGHTDMREIKQENNESRGRYLIRVAIAYIEDNPEASLIYDETKCDGYCLYGELKTEFDLED